MRLDKYLKVSRIVKRRTLANELCDAGRVQVNGRVARASFTLKTGDEIELSLGQRLVRVKVLDTQEKPGKDLAREMYEVLS